MKLTITIPTKEVKDILETAMNSGALNYWAEVKSYNSKTGCATLREHNDEEDKKKRGPWIRLTPTMLLEGLQRCAEAPHNEGGWAFTSWYEDRIGDMQTADNIIQFAVLKELKYG